MRNQVWSLFLDDVVPKRNKDTSNAAGTVGRVFGILLVALGSIDLVRQLAAGVPVPQIQWVLFMLVGGPGVAIFLISPLFAYWSNQLSEAPPEDGDDNYSSADIVDDAGDAGDQAVSYRERPPLTRTRRVNTECPIGCRLSQPAGQRGRSSDSTTFCPTCFPSALPAVES